MGPKCLKIRVFWHFQQFFAAVLDRVIIICYTFGKIKEMLKSILEINILNKRKRYLTRGGC
jgi:hypothetical protein